MGALERLSRPRPLRVDGYVKGEKATIHVLPVAPGKYMRADAAIAFLRMVAAALLAGVVLTVNSAFRLMAEQEELYLRHREGTGNLAAKPGFSNHQGGIAVDIETGGTNTPVYLWLARNAHRFGFVRTVPSEPWHWEYRPGEEGVAL
jgi:LAS superfamily LD-carboxypeptidase LdcB